jgi:nitrite reductase (NO-forming)
MKRLTFLVAIALLALMVAACGGNEESDPAPITLNFTGFDEFRYDPTDVTVPAGSLVTVNFTNDGVLEHNWMLSASTVDPANASEADALGGAMSGLTPSGETKTFTFTAPAAGTYQILCTVPGHALGGMIATFTVE